MTEPVEVELKLEFQVRDRQALLAAPLLEGAGRPQQLFATYFDTPGGDIRRAGFTLRVRRHGQRRIQTVKAAGKTAGLFIRPEWERTVPADRPLLDPSCGPLSAILGSAGRERIAPAFTVVVERTPCRIAYGDVAIDCAIDVGEIRAGGRVEAVSELELELGEGSPAALFAMARAFDAVVPLRLGILSKSDRGYRLLEGATKAESVRLEPETEAGDAFHAIGSACIRQFRIAEDHILRAGGADPVHHARVALRRLRSAFTLFRPLIATDRQATPLGDELRWLAGALGRIRNIDVLIPRFDDEEVGKALVAGRARVFDEVATLLDSTRARMLLIDLTEWLALGAWRTDPSDPALLRQPVADYAEAVLGERFRKLGKRGRHLARLDDARRHKVRIDAKKLRYAVEFFASLYPGRRHKSFLKALEALQDRLGLLNDMAVAADVLAQLDIDARVPMRGQDARDRLLAKAEKAFDALLDAPRFWKR